MKGFGECLHQARRPQWSEQYLDYSSLKKLLSRFYERRMKLISIEPSHEVERFFPNGDLQKIIKEAERSAREPEGDFVLFETNPENVSPARPHMEDTLARYEREEFCYALDQEIDSITSFYLTQLTLIEHRLASTNLAVKKTICGRSTEADEEGGSELARFKDEFKAIGGELLELYVFVTANITALNQILIRYDGMIRIFDGPPLGQWYLVTRREGYFGKSFHSFLSYEALPRMSSELLVSLQSFSVQMHQNKQSSPQTQTESDNCNSYAHAFSNKLASIECYLFSAEQALGKATDGPRKVSDSVLHSVQHYFVAGSRLNDIILQPGFIKSRGKQLTKEIKFCAKWRQKGSIIEDTESGERPQLDFGPLLISLLSSVLCNCNHYIIEPSSTKYIHELGGHDALSGLLIGMTPWAAVFSAFIYSMWSNHSFKQPLICSAVLLSLGSLVYASALKFQSIPVAMAGRILTGLGVPCAIHRRFIADTVPSTLRTAASASFATAGAIGHSIGPGLAIALDFLDFEIDLPFVGVIEVNGMTAPGYFMFLCWIIYLTLVIWKFEEKERTGLHELKEKEEKSRKEVQYRPPDHSNLHTSTSALRRSDSVIYDEDDDDDSTATAKGKIFKPPKRYVNQATIICMSFVFIGKFVLECLNSSNSIVTRHRYDWSVRNIGTLSLANGMLVVPTSTTVGFLSQRYTDRVLTSILVAVGFFGVFLLVDVTDFGVDPNDDGYNHDSWASVGPYRFIAGQMISFSSLAAFESVSMSMLSKVVPFRLAKGTFNAGFLTSVFFMLGRACGDVFITLMGLISLRNLLNLLAIPCLLTLSICLALLRVYRHKLSV